MTRKSVIPLSVFNRSFLSSYEIHLISFLQTYKLSGKLFSPLWFGAQQFELLYLYCTLCKHTDTNSLIQLPSRPLQQRSPFRLLDIVEHLCEQVVVISAYVHVKLHT